MRLLLASAFALAGCNLGSPLAVDSDGGLDGGFYDLPARIDLATDDRLSTMDAFVPAPCGPSTPVFGGTLCGPATAPCVKQRDEAVPGTGGFNDAPAIAADATGQPTILIPTGTTSGPGTLARRDAAGAWSSAPLPTTTLLGSLVARPDGIYASLYDGAFGATWRAWKSGAWQPAEPIFPQGIVYNHGLAADDTGCFYAAALDGSDQLELAERTGIWESGSPLSPPLGANQPRIALAPSGQVHVVAMLALPAGGAPAWLAPPLAPEAIELPTPGFVSDDRLLIGVTSDGQLGRPHVLFTWRGAVRYASRPATGGWNELPVAVGSESGCATQPWTAGITCTRDRVGYAPVAVLTTGADDVRLIYLRSEIVTQEVSECPPGPGGPHCYYSVVSTTESAQLSIAWPGAGSLGSAVLADLPAGTAGDATVDASGTIHVVVLDAAGGVRYLSFSE